jgi:LuxR family maltose regulon positive regulatory protein
MTKTDNSRKIDSISISEAQLYVRPQAADRKLRAAQTLSQTVYLYGVSGCGKTSLLYDYLGRRRYLYFSAEKLCEADLDIPYTSKQTIVIIDDLHMLRTDELREGLQSKIEKLAYRDDVWLILAGRSRLPSWLVPLYYRRVFTVIEENDMLLSPVEMASYMSLWGLALCGDDLNKIMKFSFGIGIVARLIAMHLAAGGTLDDTSVEKLKNEFWDYLDFHVFDQWDTELQEFLMQLCIVDVFDKRLAEMITGRSDVEKMISQAELLGNFIVMKDVAVNSVSYEIRTGMRRCMVRRLMRTYSKEKWTRLYYNAGLYYELSNDTPGALKMYEACNDMERIAGLLVSNARKNPASGHYYELRKYYLSLPEDKIRESIELMAGMSMLQSMLLNTDESERWYNELKKAENELSGSARKTARSWVTYLDIGIPHRGSMTLLDVLKNAGTLLMNRNIVLPEFSVTSNMPSQMNGGKDFCEWSKRDRELAASIGKLLEFTLGQYGKGLVSLALAESFLEKGEDSYEIANLANKGMLQAQSGGKIEQCFVAAAILAWLHVINDHYPDANELLCSFRKRAEQENAVRIIQNLTALQIRIGLYQGRVAEALDWLDQLAPDEEIEFSVMERYRYLTKARVYILAGKYERAVNLLQRLRYYAKIMHRTYISIEAGILLSIAQYRSGDDKWDETLKRSLSEAESYHFVRMISREGAAINRMLRETSWKPKQEKYYQAILSETGKMSLAYPAYLKASSEESAFSENAIRILKLQGEGMSTVEIASVLELKIETVKYHNKQNYKKLGVNSKTAAVTEARRLKLI